MGLEIRHNRAKNFHENTQFRRIAIGLNKLFIQKGWDGLLIGNPESEDYSRFRADAILLYNHGLLIIDLKDYQGTINLSKRDDEFTINKWYIETEKDKFRLEVKGASFNNPFIQLKSYRQVMYEVINNNIILNSIIDPSRVAAVNLFSGPIQLNRETPRNVPFYIITQESEFSNFLYDYNSPNTFSEDAANALKQIFPATVWEEQNETSIATTLESKVFEIDNDLEKEIYSFLENEDSEILVLESMDVSQRDEWVKYILGEVGNHNIPQTETWTHSTRIREKVKKRSGITPHSLYNTIYGGPAKLEETKEADGEENVETENNDDEHQVIIPVKSDFGIDEKAVIILHEAHLVTRSLNQSELLRFGSGRLLEDLLFHLSLGKTKRKLICIGDPFFLSYGREEESAIVVNTLNQLFDGTIRHYRQAPNEVNENGRQILRTDLANAINDKIYNKLKYNWKENDLILVDKPEVLNLIKNWFSTVQICEPSNAVLVYKNDDARTTNIWIKENCLKNTKELSKGDLLLINNNVNISDETGFGGVTRLYNGMYLTIIEKLETHTEPIYFTNINQPVNLEFIKIKVQCLSIENKPVAEVWLFNNYFEGNGKLSQQEQIAFKRFTDNTISKFKKVNEFNSSNEFTQLNQNTQYLNLKKEIKEFRIKFESGDRVKTKLEELERELRKIERKYKKEYHQRIVFQVTKSDPFLNAISANYGWCITIHKSVGSLFEKIIVNAKQGDANGVTNQSYFRWLYSGISSSQSKAFIINPEEINPLINCQYEDLTENNWDNDTNTNNTFEIENFEIPKRYEDKIDINLSKNAKAAICILSEYIEKNGVILEQTRCFGDYLSKATFSTQNGSNIVIAFNNNGQGSITSIRQERMDDSITEIVEKGILNVWSFSNQDYNETKELPNDFRKKIYANWIDNSNKIGGHLTLIISHPYHDIFQYTIDSDKIKFKVTYNGSGFFTHINIIKRTSIEISNNLKNLLFYGN